MTAWRPICVRSVRRQWVLLSPNLTTRFFFFELLVGVHEALDQEGYTVILGTTFDRPEKQDALLSTMLEHRVGGVIMSPVPGCSAEMLERLRQWDIPVVLFARDELPAGQFDYIGIDNIAGGRMAVEHLLEGGHRRIAFIGGSPQSSVWKARRSGYSEALRAAGIEMDDTLLVPSATTRQGGRMAVKRLLQHPNPPTALFCYNDVVAFGAMLGLKEEGIVPGRDIAVVGFDNIQESALFQPPLTTVAAFPEKIGAYAAKQLHERMKGDARVHRNGRFCIQSLSFASLLGRERKRGEAAWRGRRSSRFASEISF